MAPNKQEAGKCWRTGYQNEGADSLRDMMLSDPGLPPLLCLSGIHTQKTKWEGRDSVALNTPSVTGTQKKYTQEWTAGMHRLQSPYITSRGGEWEWRGPMWRCWRLDWVSLVSYEWVAHGYFLRHRSQWRVLTINFSVDDHSHGISRRNRSQGNTQMLIVDRVHIGRGDVHFGRILSVVCATASLIVGWYHATF